MSGHATPVQHDTVIAWLGERCPRCGGRMFRANSRGDLIWCSACDGRGRRYFDRRELSARASQRQHQQRRAD